MNPLDFLTGWKTYLAGAGLIGLAIYQLSLGQYEQAWQSLMAGLALLGLRRALTTEIKNRNR